MHSILFTDEGKLALAICKGDAEAAERAMADMAITSRTWEIALRAARQHVDPPAPLPPVEPFELPARGHAPGSTLGKPVFQQ
ncbi:hypothetical protein DAH66_12805 [Sphingomonas koreensis]|uniref:Uncharacterized protein n=1 Tax=Sphingomonas koreensis TaxID=93064 RepID=A0A430G2F0_9SPHN|nr:hypothetical protein [Sphingomonas koreensis]RSY83143.1 hypothetical protein DAH66_12805 [Sphingomonas koreensis]